MLRWFRLLTACVLAYIPTQPADAHPIRVNFTVAADPADPVLGGATSPGYFIYDSSIVPYGGGTLSSSYPPGLQLSSISFSWDGHTWTTADAFAGILTF